MKIGSIIKKINNDRSLIFILIFIFLVSRISLFFMGFKFDMRFLNVAWQNVDIWLLKTDLLRSIWYLHSQPPFYNLFIGIILKLFPVYFTVVFELIYHFLGLLLGLCLYSIIKNLTNNKLLSFLISTLFVISPSVILFEGLFFYDFIVVVTLVLVLFFFQKFVYTNNTGYLVAFFSTAAFLVLTRRVFHLVWFVVLTAMLLYFYRHEWKRILLSLSIPLLLIVFWYGKNLYYFGNFDASSWTGMGFFKTAAYSLTQDERQRLFSDGIVSENIFYGSDPFRIPVLSLTTTSLSKSTIAVPVVGNYMKKDGGINYNYYAYINLSKELKNEFISILKHRPAVYAKGLVVTTIIFFSPASGYFAASENNNAIDVNYQLVKKWDILFDRLIYGQPLSWGGDKLKNYLSQTLNIKSTQAWRLLSPGILLIAVYLISTIYGLSIIFRKNSISINGLSFYLTITFIIINVLYVSAVGILAEAGENQRHRFIIEPFVWVLFSMFIQSIIFRNKK